MGLPLIIRPGFLVIKARHPADILNLFVLLVKSVIYSLHKLINRKQQFQICICQEKQK